MTTRATYAVCVCGHRDDWHQTCDPDVVLDPIQRPCYGVNGVGCSCSGWRTGVRYGNRLADSHIDKAYNYENVKVALKWWKFPFEVVHNEQAGEDA